MPKVVFTYWNGKALGESGRLLLSYGGQEFEDVRVTEETWPNIKPTTPFAQVPMIEIDGKKYAQSLAIARYLGRKYALAGATLEEDLEIDMYADYLTDVRDDAADANYETDEAIKKKKYEELAKNQAKLIKLNEIIEKNNGYIALGRLTWADFVFAGSFDYLKYMLQVPDLEKKYPGFKKVVDHVYSLPQLQAYLASAPKTEI